VVTSNRLNILIFVPHAKEVPNNIKEILTSRLAELSPRSEAYFDNEIVRDKRPSHPRSIDNYRYLLDHYQVANSTGAWVSSDYLSQLDNLIRLNI